jgi:hypothetical protein
MDPSAPAIDGVAQVAQGGTGPDTGLPMQGEVQ